jgi:hypothetical protein
VRTLPSLALVLAGGMAAAVAIGADFVMANRAAAQQQQSADQVVLDLNHAAMDAYNNMDINRAGSMLEEALRVAQQANVRGPLLSQTNMNLAIVYVGGLGDNDGGVRYFVDALCADPSAQLDPLTSTPDIQSVFQVAAARVQQQGCGKGSAPSAGAPRAAPNVSPGAAAATMPEEEPAGPGVNQDIDKELPPGWGAGNSDGAASDFKRAFFQMGLALGLPWVGPGMLADRRAPTDQVFVHADTGGKIANPEAYIASKHPEVLRFPGLIFVDGMDREIIDPNTGQNVGVQQQNAWEPDRDSYDGYVNPQGQPEPFTPSSCAADGVETGPGKPAGLYPSQYCVRVNKSGFAPQAALRAAFGYFVTRDFSLAALTRFQFSAGQGTLSHLLLGVRAEYMFTKTTARGLMVSGFIGGTIGQIQAQPSTPGARGDEPWIKSGLQGAHIGSNIRYRFTNNLGIYMSPELDMQFPDFLWNIDLTILGAEVAF